MEIEVLRCELVCRWNTFMRLSGSIILKNPSFDTCIKAMFLKFMIDMNVKLFFIL